MARGGSRSRSDCMRPPDTVRAHLQHLMAKLGVHTTLEAVALTRSRLGAPAPLGQDPGSAA